MYTIYRVKTEELNDNFLTALKTLFQGKTIEIVVCEAVDDRLDETDYLLRDPVNRQRLLDAIANVERGHTVECDVSDF